MQRLSRAVYSIICTGFGNFFQNTICGVLDVASHACVAACRRTASVASDAEDEPEPDSAPESTPHSKKKRGSSMHKTSKKVITLAVITCYYYCTLT